MGGGGKKLSIAFVYETLSLYAFFILPHYFPEFPQISNNMVEHNTSEVGVSSVWVLELVYGNRSLKVILHMLSFVAIWM